MKFFELVPSGTNFPFIGRRWYFISISLFAIALSIGAMIYRQVTTGAPFNFGIDFAGGSQIRLALDPEKDPGIDTLRETLVDLGYEGSSVVSVPDAEHEVLVRVKETISISEEELEKCEAAARAVADVELLRFNHPEGGSKIFLSYATEPNYRAVEAALNEAGCEGTADKGFGGADGQFPVDFSLIGVGNRMQEQFDERFGEGTVLEIVRAETVGAKVGDQLAADGAKALLYSLGFIFLFVMIRYDIRFAPGGIVALIHDGFLVIGAFAITGKEFNLQTIAAVLTIVGYSINDTIVIFDRVRERVALFRDEDIAETTNKALNETLSRTVLTSTTTLIVVLATYIWGSGAIKDFAFALIIGIVVGSYSTLFIAVPVFLWINKRFYGGRGHLEWQEKQEREGTGTLLAGASDAEQAQRPEGQEAPDPAALIPGGHTSAGNLGGGDRGRGDPGGGDPRGGDLPGDADEIGGDLPRRTRRRRRRPQDES